MTGLNKLHDGSHAACRRRIVDPWARISLPYADSNSPFHVTAFLL